MELHEYQAKQILRDFGLPVPNGEVATTPEGAKAIAERLGKRVVIKAQVHMGGRGKAGGIKLADTPDEAYAAARRFSANGSSRPRTRRAWSPKPCW